MIRITEFRQNKAKKSQNSKNKAALDHKIPGHRATDPQKYTRRTSDQRSGRYISKNLYRLKSVLKKNKHDKLSNEESINISQLKDHKFALLNKRESPIQGGRL